MDNLLELKAEKSKYTPYYCEENIYLLVRDFLNKKTLDTG